MPHNPFHKKDVFEEARKRKKKEEEEKKQEPLIRPEVEVELPETEVELPEGIIGSIVSKGGKTFIAPGSEAENLAEIQQRRGIPDLSEQIKAQREERIEFEKEKSLVPLEEKQVKELQAIDELKSLESQADTATRLIQAGQISIGQAMNFLSLGAIPNPEVPTQEQIDKSPFLAKKVIGAIGRISTISVPFTDWSLSDLGLGSAASGNIANLQGDVSKMITESQVILRNSLTRSPNRPESNLNQSIQSQIILEEAARVRYEGAVQSLKESPKDIKEGLDLMDAMSSDLRVIVENRQMLERYKITKDPTEIMNVLGGIPLL